MTTTAGPVAPRTLEPTTPPPSAPPSNVVARLGSIDAFRGFVMFLMLAEAMRLWTVHEALPNSWFWRVVAFNTEHVQWQGCSLHDLIQPAFSFLVGAAMPFSIASRTRRGESFRQMLAHAAWRSVVLVFLGIFLRSLNAKQTYWTFEDTLTQIGLGYTILFALAFASRRVQVAVFVGILVAFWAAFVAYPLPPAGFDYARVGVPADWPHLYTGFLAHFNKNSNLSWAFDVWFLNLFPREQPFLYNSGGWSTLSFIPTLATMMLGLWAGRWLMQPRAAKEQVRGLVIAGVALTSIGLALQWLHVVPVVKRIWTSSYTLYSGGLVLLILAAFHAAIEWKGWRRWAFPLLVIGMNSIAAYVMSWTLEGFVTGALARHVGSTPFAIFGDPFVPVLRGAAVLTVFWLILWWMYRRKIFLRI